MIFLFLCLLAPCFVTAQEGDWSILQFGIGKDFYAVEVVEDQILLVGGSICVRSYDNGSSWDTTTFRSEGTSISSTAVSFVSKGVGFVADTALYVTRDAGNTWDRLSSIVSPITVSPSYFTAMNFFDERLGVGVGPDGTYLRTTDGGATWSSFFASCIECNGIVLVSDSLGFLGGYETDALGVRGTFAQWKSTDNKHFVPMASFVKRSADFRINSLAVLDAQTWWIAGSVRDDGTGLLTGRLDFTTTGGETYFQPSTAIQHSITAVSFVNSNRGYLGTEAGEVYRTDDGGYTWILDVRVPGELRITDIQATERAVVVACDRSTALLLRNVVSVHHSQGLSSEGWLQVRNNVISVNADCDSWRYTLYNLCGVVVQDGVSSSGSVQVEGLVTGTYMAVVTSCGITTSALMHYYH